MEEIRISRAIAEYVPKHERFLINSKNYVQQYSHLYVIRLAEMRESLSSLAAAKWGASVPILTRIIDSEGNDKVKGDCILIGTLFKEMHLRSSVLDEFKESNGICGGVQAVYNYASKDDFLVLEDDSGRIGLGSDCVTRLAPTTVTGIVCAIKGAVDESGIFNVVDILFSGESLLSPKEDSKMIIDTDDTLAVDESDFDQYVLFVSGLQMGMGGHGTIPSEGSEDTGLASQLLMDYIAGRLGGEKDIKTASQIVRVVVAGNSVAAADTVKGTERYTGSKHQSLATQPVKELDALLSTALGSCPFDIMPGASDPANVTLPQQPLHACLLPNSSRFNTLNLVPNPYNATLGGVNILGHAGQPVRGIARQTIREELLADNVNGDREVHIDLSIKGVLRETGDNPIVILRNTLRWGHMCPIAPDTLSCYPFTDNDPFIIKDLKNNKSGNIYFTGNQDKYESSLEISVDGCRTLLVCVPIFKKTKEVVLVNIKTFECKTLSFQTFPNFNDNI
jgi:DNA polymerase delta subunit 2